MLHHVSVGVTDFERAAKFYDAVLKTLGFKRVADYSPHAIGYGETHPEFWIGAPHDGKPMHAGNGVHMGFTARTKAQVRKFHEAALKMGASNNGEPGPRPDYGPDYYGAFVYDLDGNKIEATFWNAPLAAPKKPAASRNRPPWTSRAAKPKAKKKKAAASRNRPHGTAAAMPGKKKKKAKKR